MSEKIAFLKKLPPHLNVVQLLGAIDDGSTEGSFIENYVSVCVRKTMVLAKIICPRKQG